MWSDASTRKGDLVTFSEAIVKVRIGETSRISAAEAMARSKRTTRPCARIWPIPEPYQGLEADGLQGPIFQGGTDAVCTRVLIDSTDETGESWTTVGVGANIIDALIPGLTESVVYKLLRMHMAGTLPAE